MRWMGSWGTLRLAGGINGLLLNARLAWRLLRDGRVPLRNKLILPAAALYLVWPLDFIVDLLPFLGQVDDVTALVLATLFFVNTAPRGVVAQHRDALSGAARRTRRVRRDDAIEGTYRVVDEEERR